MPRSGRAQAPNRRRQARLEAEASGRLGRFEGCKVLAYLGRNLSFNAEGGMSVSFVIPAEAVEDALVLRHLAANPMPLELSVSVFEPFAKRVDDDEARLRALGDG